MDFASWNKESAHLNAWEFFAVRQHARYVPIKDPANHHMLPAAVGYRLRVAGMVGIQLGPVAETVAQRGGGLELRIGVSMYDEVTGTFYGNTCSSLPSIPINVPADGLTADTPLNVSIDQDVYYLSRLVDERCLVVLDIIVVESLDKVALREVSVGWAALPTVQAGNMAARPGATLTAPLRAGSLRYLLWGTPRSGHPPPANIPGAVVHFCLERYPAADRFAHLLPSDFTVTYSDVIPGLGRFDYAGNLTYSVCSGKIISSMANPIVQPPLAVCVKTLMVLLPSGLDQQLKAMTKNQVRGSVPNKAP